MTCLSNDSMSSLVVAVLVPMFWRSVAFTYCVMQLMDNLGGSIPVDGNLLLGRHGMQSANTLFCP